MTPTNECYERIEPFDILTELKITNANFFGFKSSSSSCRATSTDIPDPLSSLLSIAGPQGYTPYPHRAAVWRVKLVALLLLGHV